MPKVLIVDDSLSVRRALERVLSAKDFEVVSARSGEEALERFAAVVPDLTIADVIMPGIGGFELCRKLRERDPQTPVILISGVGDAQIEQQARAVGAAAVIPKPFSPEDLSAALNAALNPPEPQLPEPQLPEPQLPESQLPESQLLEPQPPERESLEPEPEPSKPQLPEPEPEAAESSEPELPEPEPEPLAAGFSAAELPEPTDIDSPLPNVGPDATDVQNPALQAAELQSDEAQADLPGTERKDAELPDTNFDQQSAERTDNDARTPAEPDLVTSLTRFLEKPEVLAATLSDRHGSCLAHVGEHATDAETLASYSRFLLVASDVLGTHYGADPTDGMVLEFPQYALYLGRVDAEHILSLHLSDAKALSVVRYLTNRTLPELASGLRGLRG